MSKEKTPFDIAHGHMQDVGDAFDKYVLMSDSDTKLLMGVLAMGPGGSVLLESKPGTGKTTTANVLGTLIDGEMGRVQGSHDKTGADIVGSSLWLPGSQEFEFRKGPVFKNVVLFDEVSRLSPKALDAALQPLAEGYVTDEVTSQQYALPDVRMFMATRNPLGRDRDELDLATLDRFTASLPMRKPSQADRKNILAIALGNKSNKPVSSVIDLEDMRRVYKIVEEEIDIPGGVEDHALTLIDELEKSTAIDMKNSTIDYSSRPEINLLRLGKAMALINRKKKVTPEIIDSIAGPVLRHRIKLTRNEHANGNTVDNVIQETVDSL